MSGREDVSGVNDAQPAPDRRAPVDRESIAKLWEDGLERIATLASHLGQPGPDPAGTHPVPVMTEPEARKPLADDQ